jgi:hypothetical protein
MTLTDIPDEVTEFFYNHFRAEYVYDSDDVLPDERAEIDEMVESVSEALDRNVGELGMAINFVIVAEKLSQVDSWHHDYDPEITISDVLARYDRKDVDTFTILYDGEQYGIRSVQNEIRDLFRYDLRRTNFPSSPGHHTGDWEKYDSYLGTAFRLSRSGRFEALNKLFELGLDELHEKRFESRDSPFPRVFLRVIDEYQRSHPDENGGLAFQAIAYGYIEAEWSHLSLRASKVRTGSERQNRYGDIDGFYGPDLMISVEVKDKGINMLNMGSELGTMLGVAEDTTSIPIAIIREITEDARQELESSGVRVLSDDDLIANLQFWDFHKENRALHGMLHYLANIEEDAGAVQRLLEFVESIDEGHRVLDHYLG